MSWTPEANVIAESDAVFREVELVARDLTFVSVASNQLLQDNAVAAVILCHLEIRGAIERPESAPGSPRRPRPTQRHSAPVRT